MTADETWPRVDFLGLDALCIDRIIELARNPEKQIFRRFVVDFDLKTLPSPWRQTALNLAIAARHGDLTAKQHPETSNLFRSDVRIGDFLVFVKEPKWRLLVPFRNEWSSTHGRKRGGKGGRKKGPLYAAEDAELREEMHVALKSGKFRSVNAAALHFAERAPGATLESRQRRLTKSFRAKYPL